jgi:hypothetical protein
MEEEVNEHINGSQNKRQSLAYTLGLFGTNLDG